MKKHILMGAALLSLFATSCSNDDIIENGNEMAKSKTVTLNVTINNDADVRMTYQDDGSSMKVTWSSEESFTMYKDTISKGSEFKNSADETDKFKGDDITGDGKYYAVYGDNITNNAGTLSIDLTGEQVGTSEENGIKEFMLASANALTSGTTLSFDHKLTVLKLILTLPSDVTGTVSKVTVSGLHNKASYALSNDSYAYTDEGKGDITATNGTTGFAIADNKITAYVAVFPENVSANQVTIKAYVDDNEYSYTIATARKLAAGKVVPVNVSLVKVVQTNFKSAYIKDDYKTWSEDNCGSAATYEQMMMYLGAGVYWDNGETGENQQTYQALGKTYHAGLWVMKKAYIGSDVSASTVAKEENGLFTVGRPAASDIDKYFFLPAAGNYYPKFDYSNFQGQFGYYWLNTTDESDSENPSAYNLSFGSGGADLGTNGYNLGFLPMIAE